MPPGKLIPLTLVRFEVMFDGYDPKIDVRVMNAVRRPVEASGYGGGRRDMQFSVPTAKVQATVARVKSLQGIPGLSVYVAGREV